VIFDPSFDEEIFQPSIVVLEYYSLQGIGLQMLLLQIKFGSVLNVAGRSFILARLCPDNGDS
jgi:hypothetical protein